MKNVLVGLLAVVLLLGCSASKPDMTEITTLPDGTTITKMDPEVQLSMKYLDNKKERELRDDAKFNKIVDSLLVLADKGKDTSAVAMALMSMKFSDDMRQMAVGMTQAYTGKSGDGMSYFDLKIAEVQSKNTVWGKVTDGVFSTVKILGGAIIVKDALLGLTSNAGTTTNNIAGGDLDISGSYNNFANVGSGSFGNMDFSNNPVFTTSVGEDTTLSGSLL